jgi:hypothetical protein
MHCDKHVVKMILETAQMLCTAQWHFGIQAPYKKTHVNHPSSKWARENTSNYMWLCRLGKELCNEYRYRYGAHKRHKSEDIIDWCLDNPPINMSDGEFSPPPLAMPKEYYTSDHILSYRIYYIKDKSHILAYTKRSIPIWVGEMHEYKRLEIFS